MFYLVEHEKQVSLIHIPKSEKELLFYPLMKALFFNDKNQFYSLTESEDEISLFVDEEVITEEFKGIPSNVKEKIVIKDGYRILEFHENDCGIDHIGIVNKISDIFSKNDIPILYVNTFNKNLILVHKDYYSNAQTCLHENMNINNL